MRKNMQEAFDRFISGKDYMSGSIRVESIGESSTLFSYTMPIAWRSGKQIKIISGKSPSKTTSCHINQIKALSSYLIFCNFLTLVE